MYNLLTGPEAGAEGLKLVIKVDVTCDCWTACK